MSKRVVSKHYFPALFFAQLRIFMCRKEILCARFFFLETVYLGATTLFKKISRNKDVKSSNCSLVCHYNTSSLAKFLFYFQQFLKYIYYTIMMYFFLFSFIFKKANVSVDTA